MGRVAATEPTSAGWRTAVGVQFIPAVMIALMVPFTPESPRWLILHNKPDEAQKALDKLRKKSQVDNGNTREEVQAIQIAISESENMGHGSWTDLFRGNYPRRSLIAIIMFYGNQCCGNQVSLMITFSEENLCLKEFGKGGGETSRKTDLGGGRRKSSG